MAGTADLHKAIDAVWEARNLESKFKKTWSDADKDEYAALNDQESTDQPFPYCIFQFFDSTTMHRDSGTVGEGQKNETRSIPLEFRVHAREKSGSSKSAKRIALNLAGEIMKAFGGDAQVAPANLCLDNGGVVYVQYQNDFGTYQGDEEYQWVVEYLITVDVPVALRVE